MWTTDTSNVNIISEQIVRTPKQLKESLPITAGGEAFVLGARATIQSIIAGSDPRVMVIVGPCSIHSPEVAIEYAQRLSELSPKVKDALFLVMRTYFEKPRTSIGWKGLINDPYLNDTFAIEDGLYAARKLLLQLGAMRVPVGTEALDPVVPQYLDDVVTWNAIGARTTESQTHREMASGLSTPVGFKNGTDGNLDVAINALKSVAVGHHFLGINQDGQCTVLKTKGNLHAHLVLRGGNGLPNYDSLHVARCEKLMSEARIAPRLVVDCSHGNSMKDPSLQPAVARDCARQIVDGNRSIVGLMLESNLVEGNQPLPKDLSQLRYGVSITDACIGWKTTESLLSELADKLRPVLGARRLLK